MADASFKPHPFSGFTTRELRARVDEGKGSEPMVAEIARRERVLAGDVSIMTPAERLRHIKAGAA